METLNVISQFEDKEDQDFYSKCSSISEDIKANKLNILELIENLRELMTNKSPSKRELGIAILTEVLRNLNQYSLTDQQLKIILGFYIEKLKDHHQVVPVALKGILLLLEYEHFCREKIPDLLNTIFENVSCQQQQRGERFNIYCIFRNLLEKFPGEIMNMGLHFVYGVINSIDGERDPTNLIFLFKWLKTFLNLVPLGHLAEEMFDVIACYFPVDFKASLNESTITREALAEALCSCMCGHPDFGELCIAVALEKMDSSLEVAKKDSLMLLKEGCSNFPPKVYLDNAKKIWPQLEKEIFSNSSYEVKQLCFESLTLLTRIISNEADNIKAILKNIFDTVKGNLMPESNLFLSSMDMLLNTAMGSSVSSDFITAQVVPLLTNIYKITTKPSQKVTILEYLVKFWKIYHDFHHEESEMLASIPILLLDAIMETTLDLKISGFYGLARMMSHLSLNVRTVLYENICNAVVQTDGVVLREAVLCCFKNVAVCYEDEFRELILNKITINDKPSLDLFLDSLRVLVGLDNFKLFVVKTLMMHLRENTKISLKNIKAILEQNSEPEVIQLFMQNNIIITLIDLAYEYISDADTEILLIISSLLKLLIGPQDKNSQVEIVDCYLEKVHDNLKKSERYVILLDGLVARLLRDIEIDIKVLDCCLLLAMSSKSDLIRDIAVQTFANMLNKKPIDRHFEVYISTLKENFVTHLKEQNRNNVISAISWTTKVLLMKNYQDSYAWVDQMLEMLELHEEVANGLKIIINDNYESMDTVSHCYKMFLYRQKFFIYVSNKLAQDYTPDKMSYLKAIGYLVEYAPKQAVLLQFKKIRRLTLMCLEKCPEEDVLHVLLNTINTILSSNCIILEDTIEDLITRLLQLTVYKNSMAIRIEAIKCLINLTTAFPVYKLLPFKRTVIDNLSVCLDDKKRLVRKEAMEARSLWFLIDAKD